LAVRIWRRHPDGQVDVVLPCDLAVLRVQPEELYATPDDPRPSLELDDDLALALLNALAAYFGGTSDVRALRQDLDTERKRADRLIEALILVATRSPA
jgi:hypothetical protein